MEKQEEPGMLKTSVSIELNTKQAVKLFYGQIGDKETGKHEITGLLRFAEKIGQITYAASRDDPYADYFLVLVEKSLEESRNKIQSIHEQMSAYSDQTLLTINQGNSIEPVVLKTEFASVYANLALDLLKYADNIIVEVLANKHVGLLETENANAIVNNIQRIMRRVFLSTRNYQYVVKLNRTEVVNKTPKYKAAHKSMKLTSELPQDLMDRDPKARAKRAPNIDYAFLQGAFLREGPAKRRSVPMRPNNIQDKK